MNLKRYLCFLAVVITGILSLSAQIDLPCDAITLTRLNVRTGPSTAYRRVTTLPKGDTLTVTEISQNNWVKIKHYNTEGYVSAKYISFIVLPPEDTLQTETTTSGSWSLFKIIFYCIVGIVAIRIGLALLELFLKLFGITLVVLEALIHIAIYPFWLTNALQRYLAKPWFPLFKFKPFSDKTNEVLRWVFSVLKVPFYVVLFPLRLINAIVFNIVVHCLYELVNYEREVFLPTLDNEGRGKFWKWIYMLPFRIGKYILWHGSLTIIESVIWTVIDTFLPALTLYHGTSEDCAESIVSSPDRSNQNGDNVGLWIVGDGNFAGNGIYFAPDRKTSLNYSKGVIIVCRVTLGRTLDLGLAPDDIFKICGHNNAKGATEWGLKNGYVTGEWWRADRSWWEYCMYDWQNRYNYSWRIRPLYIIYAGTTDTRRNPGGMHHWLFRKLVIHDIIISLRKYWEHLMEL